MRKLLIAAVAFGLTFSGTVAARVILFRPDGNPREMAKHSPKRTSEERQLWPAATTKARMLAERFDQFSANYRTEIHPAPGVRDVELELQQEIAAVFAFDDPNPPERAEAFAWCYSQPKLRVTGWTGAIRRVIKKNAGFEVEVFIQPRLAGAISYPATLSTSDYCVETWNYDPDNLTLTYVKGWRPTTGARFLFGD
jgi:hypothetical protein